MPKQSPKECTARITWHGLHKLAEGETRCDPAAPGLRYIKMGNAVYAQWRRWDPATQKRMYKGLGALLSMDELTARSKSEHKSTYILAMADIEGKRVRAWELNSMVRAGLDPKGPSPETMTVSDLAKDYLENHAEKHKRASSVSDDRSMLDIHILPKLGSKKVKAVQKADIEKLHNSLKGTPYRANRVRSLLNKLFNRAIDAKVRPDNPVRGVKPFHEEKRTRWLNDDELKRVWDLLNAHPNQQQANVVKLILYTGARKGEVLSSTWGQFDLGRGLWTKPSAHTKQKAEHGAPLSTAARKLLKSMRKAAGDDPKPDAPLFPAPDGKPLRDVKAFWETLRAEAGLPGVRIHDLRHTFASDLVSQGVPLYTVGQLLGHTQVQTTARYAHVADKAQRAAAEAFGKKLGR